LTMLFFPTGQSLSWLFFFSKGEKEPLYFLKSGSKVAHYVEVVQKCFLLSQLDPNFSFP
jgi:hypothetical protein